MNWYVEVLRKYAVFDGRSRRKEYWLFVLFNLIIALVLGFIDGALGLADTETGYGPLGLIYALAVLVPSIAVGVRRLHDTDRSGWWLLIVFIPIIGAVVLVVFFLIDSQPGSNRYGPNPKGVG
jgi:uncharacterized membrane protein YhaH (DUF805 family)